MGGTEYGGEMRGGRRKRRGDRRQIMIVGESCAAMGAKMNGNSIFD